MYKNDGVWSSETNLLKFVNVCENQPKLFLSFLLHELLAYSAGQHVLRLILWCSSEGAQNILIGFYTEKKNPLKISHFAILRSTMILSSYLRQTGIAQAISVSLGTGKPRFDFQ